MPITLTELASDQQTELCVSACPEAASIRIDGEQMQVVGVGQSPVDLSFNGIITVRRGVNLTLRSTHAPGSVVVPLWERNGRGFYGFVPPFTPSR
jgi:hypothetical protein